MGVLLKENTLLKKKAAEYEATIGRLSQALDQERMAKAQADEEIFHFQQLLENIPQMAWIALPNGWINYFNQRWYEYTGQTFETAQGFGWQATQHPEDLSGTIEMYNNMIAGREYNRESRFLRASDGTWRWHLTRAKPIRNDKGEILLWIGTCTDIHDQRETEEVLRESEERFRFMTNSIPHIVWTARPDGYEDFHNQRLLEYTGLPVEQAEGHGWRQLVHPDDLPQALTIWQNCLELGEPYRVKYRFKRFDGVYRWFLGRALPMRDPSGHVVKWFGTCTDIHDEEEVKLQLQAANQELIRMNQVLDTFVYMAAHDLKSPVTNLQVLMQMADIEKGSAKRKELQRMIDLSIKRLNQTINGLLEVISVEGYQYPATEVHFQQILKDILTEHCIHPGSVQAGIKANFGAGEKMIYIGSYLQSVLKNLITNAIKYHSPARPLEIRITTQKVAAGMWLTVADNGIGIDLVANANRIFKPFKRFTQQAQGTGVGLYIIKTIVEKNGGRIEVESELDVGTTFKVLLVEY